MQLRELFDGIGGDPMAILRDVVSLVDKGFVTYDPETMELDLTPSGEFVNAPVQGHA